MGSRCETKEVCQGFTFFWFLLEFLLLRSNFGHLWSTSLAHISRSRYWAFTLNKQLICCSTVVYFVGINGIQSFAMYFWHLLYKKDPLFTTNCKITIFFSTTLVIPNVKIHCHAKMHPCAKFEAIWALLPWIWSWSITFALRVMNLLPRCLYLWRDV